MQNVHASALGVPLRRTQNPAGKRAGNQKEALDIFAAALPIARSINNEFFRNETLRAIGVAQAKSGDFRSAMKTAMKIEEGDDDRARALADIAKHFAAQEKN